MVCLNKQIRQFYSDTTKNKFPTTFSTKKKKNKKKVRSLKVIKVDNTELLFLNNKCKPGQYTGTDTGQFKKCLRV